MNEINYKDMKFNPFNLFGKKWMLVSAGNEQDDCNSRLLWFHRKCCWQR